MPTVSNETTPQALILSEQLNGALIAAFTMESIGQETEAIHQKNLAKAKIRQLMAELEMQEVDCSIHQMD